MQNIAPPQFSARHKERSYSIIIIIIEKFYASCLIIQPVMQIALQLFHFRSWRKITPLRLHQQIIIHKEFYAIFNHIKVCLSVQQGRFDIKVSLYAARFFFYFMPYCVRPYQQRSWLIYIGIYACTAIHRPTMANCVAAPLQRT